jgi:predicted metal-binding membrane protein
VRVPEFRLHADSGDGVSLRDAAPLWLALAVAGGAAWVLTTVQANHMGAGPGTMGMTFRFFVGMWVVMMAAMMLPALGPQAARETVLVEGHATTASRVGGVFAFGGGFLVPWAVYGALAFAAAAGAGRLVADSPDLAKWLGVFIFLVAGAYQLTPLKARALAHCRTEMAPPAAPGTMLGDALSGLRDGAVCVGCCWAMMAVLIAVGVMNLWAMVGLAILIFAEKILPAPRLVSAIGSAAFATLGIVAILHPTLLSGLHAAEIMTGGM